MLTQRRVTSVASGAKARLTPLQELDRTASKVPQFDREVPALGSQLELGELAGHLEAVNNISKG